uniref:Uncharacterized protein n=1 Tax=Lepeophtheirus salmonis TaxID=72036 RepID=A0A0K2TSX2_LEPSM
MVNKALKLLFSRYRT